MNSFLQTQSWLEFQESLGRKVWRFDDGKIKANIIRHDLPFKKNYLYIPHGPEINFNNISGSLKNEAAQFISYLKNLAKEQKSIFIKIEPLDDKVPELMHSFGFKKSSKEIQPHKSVIIDLDKSEEELLSAMHHKTRYNIKVSEKHDITVQPSFDVDIFIKLLKKTAERQKFHTHDETYYRKMLGYFNKKDEIKADIIFANYKNKPIAGGLFLTYSDTCFYLHGGSNHDYRQFMAPYALHWNAIKYLNKKGIKHYDLGGSEGTKWPNLTRFKLNWGGRQVEYPGSFDLTISIFWFLMYKIFRKIY
jgi:peptidoglycan pentaglycine glycine transferase (the first glycine)